MKVLLKNTIADFYKMSKKWKQCIAFGINPKIYEGFIKCNRVNSCKV